MRFSGHLETQCGTEQREQEGPGCSSYLYNLFLGPSKSVGFARPTFLPLESGDGGAGVVKFKDSKTQDRGFVGGAVVKNPPADIGHTGSNPGPGRSHMPRSS